jgi:DNA-binding LacI/PurR family transcriptional regulator
VTDSDWSPEGTSKLEDVARVADVSISTVSRYVRGHPVRRAEQISLAIEKLNYRPNAIARGLRSRQTHAVGVIVTDITNPFLAAAVRGIQSVGNTACYHLYLVEGNDEIEETIRELGSRVDGIICAAASGPEVVEALRATGRPTVLLEFEPVDQVHPFDAVMIDNHGGARRAGEYLLQLGHRRIGIISGPLTTSPGRERYDGFLGALTDAGVELDPAYVDFGDFSSDAGYQAASRLLGQEKPVTALFAVNNLTAIGALTYIHDAGLDIPREVSFVGFDPIDHWQLMSPAPTTVERPRREQGAIAMRLLLDRITGKGPENPRRIVLDAHLALRDTCAALM